MLADIADEVKEGEVLHPVVVVGHYGGVWSTAVEVEEVGELTFDGFLIVAQGFFVNKLALLTLHRGVADHTCGTSDNGDRFVAAALQMLEHHHTDEMAYVEAVGCRVDSEIGRCHLFL